MQGIRGVCTRGSAPLAMNKGPRTVAPSPVRDPPCRSARGPRAFGRRGGRAEPAPPTPGHRTEAPHRYTRLAGRPRQNHTSSFSRETNRAYRQHDGQPFIFVALARPAARGRRRHRRTLPGRAARPVVGRPRRVRRLLPADRRQPYCREGQRSQRAWSGPRRGHEVAGRNVRRLAGSFLKARLLVRSRWAFPPAHHESSGEPISQCREQNQRGQADWVCDEHPTQRERDYEKRRRDPNPVDHPHMTLEDGAGDVTPTTRRKPLGWSSGWRRSRRRTPARAQSRTSHRLPRQPTPRLQGSPGSRRVLRQHPRARQ